MSHDPMTVCQTCGSKGFLDLLIHCFQCQIIAVHRYCVDGPTIFEDDEVSWSCEECVPRMPTLAFRNIEHINSKVDREALRSKARRNLTNPLSLPKVEKSNCVGQRANKVADDASNLDEKKGIDDASKLDEKKKGTDDASNLDEKKKGIVKRKVGNLKENGTDPKMEDLKLAPLLRKKNKKDLNFDDGAKKENSEPSILTEQKIKDLNSLNGDGEDLQSVLEKNLGPQLTKESDHCLNSTSEADEISNGDSVAENWHKHGQSSSKIHSCLLQEQGIQSSQTAKQPDGAEDKTSDNIEDTKAVSACHRRGGKQTGYNIFEFQTRRKKRLVISMEYSDSDEEPLDIRAEHPQTVPDVEDGVIHMTNNEPPAKSADHGLAQQSFIVSNDNFPTRPLCIKSNYHMLDPTTFAGSDNRVIPSLPNAITKNHVLAQPIMNAVWRGHCSITGELCSLSFGLEAHLSNKAHERVLGAVSALPNSLSFEVVERQHAWPKSFEKSPPTGDTIGLYFFPVNERDEKRYEVLLDEMMESALVLVSHINNLELLVFCSEELPQGDKRFRSKYYLWGVFKTKQDPSLISRPTGNQTSDCVFHKKDMSVIGNSVSSCPSSVDNFSAINSSSHDSHKAGRRVADFTPSIILKARQGCNKQNCSSQLESNDIGSPAKRDDGRIPRKSCKPQGQARNSRDADFSKH